MQWTENTPINITNLNDLEARIEQANTNVVNAKTPIAQAITDMGQSASSTDAFDVLSYKIKAISTDADAGVSDVYPGKTFYQGGVKKTGAMPIASPVTATLDVNTTSKTIAAGHYTQPSNVSIALEAKTVTPTASGFTVAPSAGKVLSQVNVNGDANHIPGNIREGITDFGVLGTLRPWNGEKKYVAGSFGSNFQNSVTVSGLAFVPTHIMIFKVYDDGNSSPQKMMRAMYTPNYSTGGSYDYQSGVPTYTLTVSGTSFTLKATDGYNLGGSYETNYWYAFGD